MLTNRRSTYRIAWEKDFPWLKAVKDNVYQAECVVCKTRFQICGSGKSQVRIHGTGTRHKESEKVYHENRKIVPSTSSTIPTMSLNVVPAFFTHQELVLKAEILSALKIIKYHQSFRSAEQDSNLFSQMFPDSKIAQNYSMSRTKLMYLIRFGIAPHLKEVIIAELTDSAFSFIFDETTTAQKKSNLMATSVTLTRKASISVASISVPSFWDIAHRKILSKMFAPCSKISP
jgi:hypothetical protein